MLTGFASPTTEDHADVNPQVAIQQISPLCVGYAKMAPPVCCGIEPIASCDVQIWRAFRRKDRVVDIASLEGYYQMMLLVVSKAGKLWRLLPIAMTTLFRGSGFIDGPSKIGSTMRSNALVVSMCHCFLLHS
jgi:hypothetical protein